MFEQFFNLICNWPCEIILLLSFLVIIISGPLIFIGVSVLLDRKKSFKQEFKELISSSIALLIFFLIVGFWFGFWIFVPWILSKFSVFEQETIDSIGIYGLTSPLWLPILISEIKEKIETFVYKIKEMFS